jgi:hypothetical protein
MYLWGAPVQIQHADVHGESAMHSDVGHLHACEDSSWPRALRQGFALCIAMCSGHVYTMESNGGSIGINRVP